MSLLDSIGQGASQGATMGFGDEAVARILASMPAPSSEQDGGIPREYAAGSAEQDYLASQRGDNTRAAAENPVAYGAAQLAGGLPAAMAIPGGAGGSAAARVAATGLTGGALGALSGAGHADGQNIGNEIGKGALMGGALGTAGGAAIEALPFAKSVISQMGSPTGELAGAGAGAGAPGAPGGLGGVQVNKAGMLPPRPTTGDMPNEMFVPKAPKPLNMKGNGSKSGRSTDGAAGERPTVPENVDPKKAYRDAAHRNRQAPPARGVPPLGDDVRPTDMVPPPKKYAYKNTQFADTVPAPSAAGPTMLAPAPQFNNTPTVPAPSAQTVPAPAPEFPLSMRPTMPDLGPVRPTMRPESQQAYKDAILQEISDSARRNSL